MKKIKITFTGDIMCHQQMLENERKNPKFFDIMLEPIKEELLCSDYIIGNLETPVSNLFGYTNDRYCFNTPNKLLKSLYNNNFKMLCTANNHCFDRGPIGLKQTMKNIKKENMKCVGTSLKNESANQVIEISGVRIGILAYTYGTNYSYNHFPNISKLVNVNLLKEQKSNPNWKNYSMFDGYMLLLKKQTKAIIKKVLNIQKNSIVTSSLNNNNVVVDNINEGEWYINNDKIRKIKQDINYLSECDIKFMILHTGGQYNTYPGSFTIELVKQLKNENIDSIIGHHTHCVQQSYTFNGKIGSYSLGNFCFSTNATNIGYESKPQYSILLHYYIDTNRKKIEKITFSILKCIENSGQTQVYNTYYLYSKNKSEDLKNDIKYIYNLFSNNNCKNIEIKKEYVLKLEEC